MNQGTRIIVLGCVLILFGQSLRGEENVDVAQSIEREVAARVDAGSLQVYLRNMYHFVSERLVGLKWTDLSVKFRDRFRELDEYPPHQVFDLKDDAFVTKAGVSHRLCAAVELASDGKVRSVRLYLQTNPNEGLLHWLARSDYGRGTVLGMLSRYPPLLQGNKACRLRSMKIAYGWIEYPASPFRGYGFLVDFELQCDDGLEKSLSYGAFSGLDANVTLASERWVDKILLIPRMAQGGRGEYIIKLGEEKAQMK